MQKNTVIAVGVIALLIGFIAGSQFTGRYSPSGMHRMENGHMMSNHGGQSMEDMMSDMNAILEGKSGDEFDQAFLSEMIVHHEGAVMMAELALVNANHQEIKDLAQAIISAQNTEISQMKKWQKDWFGK